jgi:hypothetical protein
LTTNDIELATNGFAALYIRPVGERTAAASAVKITGRRGVEGWGPVDVLYSRPARRGTMDMVAHPHRRYTLEEHFELERKSEERFEFRDGEVFCMSGVSHEHGQIESNLNF